MADSVGELCLTIPYRLVNRRMRGHHICKMVWSPTVCKVLQLYT